MFEEYFDLVPKVMYLPDYDMKPETPWFGIQALTYEGIPYQGKKTENFALIGFPEHKVGEKVPAVVLVHGAGGVAFAEWVKRWNEKGFAAIAMSVRGLRPKSECKGLYGLEGGMNDRHERMPEHDGYLPMPEGYGVYDEDLPLSDTWLYQAAANAILASNILRNDSRVDVTKLGICGVSWGGVVISQVIAHDFRYSFAIPAYGSGNMHMSLSRVGDAFRSSMASRIWRVTGRYEKIPFPVLWICWSRDESFDILPNSICYEQTKGAGSLFSAILDWGHSHRRVWENPLPYRFAQSLLGEAESPVRPLSEPQGFGEVSFEISSGENVEATLMYLSEPMRYTEEFKINFEWKTKPCTVYGNRVSVTIPEDANNYYIQLCQTKDGEVFTTSTVYVTGMLH